MGRDKEIREHTIGFSAVRKVCGIDGTGQGSGFQGAGFIFDVP